MAGNIQWNLDFMGIKTRVVSPEALLQRQELARIAGMVDGAALALEYAYDMLDDSQAGTKIDRAFQRAMKALEKLSKALEAEVNGDS